MSIFLDRTSLKRNKRSFESTALNSIQHNRTVLKSQYRLSTTTQRSDDIKTKHHLRMEENNKQVEMKDGVELKSKISQIAINIMEEQRKFAKESGTKFMRHFYFRGISRINKHPILKIPEIMNKIYQQQHLKRPGPFSPPVSVNHDYLKQINCLYYTVQNKIIFIKTEDLIHHNQITDQTIPHVIYEVRSQVVTVLQLPKNNLLFQGYENVIAVVYLWEMEFYAWETDAIIKEKCMAADDGKFRVGKLKSLNYIYKFPVEKVKSLGCGADGRIFYFDDKGVLYQITPQQQTKFLICKTGRYTIKNYLNTSHNTFELLNKNTGKLAPFFNIASNIVQLSKYLLSSHIQAEIVFCDNKRSLLFALLRKQIKLLFGQQIQIFIVCYCIAQKNKTKLIHKISQEWLIDKYLLHSPSNQPKKNYQIHSISPAPCYHQTANLTITTKSSIKILMQISPNQSKIIQIIRPPNYQIFESTQPININISPFTAFSNQYSPEQINQYLLTSVCQDSGRMVYTVCKGGCNYSFVVERSYFGGGVDINLRANAVEMDVYKQGSWNVSVHKISNQLSDQINQLTNLKHNNQLCTQLITPPQHYLFHSQTKLQLITYLRPIDILYTALTCLIKQRPSQRNNLTPQQLISKQKLLRHIFVTKSNQFSLVGNVGIEEIQLCVMLLQIVVQEGEFQYSGRAAQEIEEIWKQLTVDSRNIYKQDNRSIRSQWTKTDPQPQPKPTQQPKHNNTNNKNTLIRQQSKHQLQTISSSTPNPIVHKLNTIIMYTSKLLHPIWNTPLQQISTKIAETLLRKIQLLEKYMRECQSSFKVYSQSQVNTNRQLQQVYAIVSNIRQLLLLIINVPIQQFTIKFSDTLSGCPELQQCIFEAIRKQYKYYVINLWKSLFPNFITNQLMKIVILYGQLQQIQTTEQLILQLQHQQYVNKFPQYFLRYLQQTHNLTNLNTILKTNPNMKPQQYNTNITDPNNKQYKELSVQRDRTDYQFVIPGLVRDIVERFGKIVSGNGELSQSDVEGIVGVVMDRDGRRELTITNKQSLFTYIFKHLPRNGKLDFLSKCVSVQYQLYRYYLHSVQSQSLSTQSQKAKLLTRILHMRRQTEQPVLRYNQQTMELLRYKTLVDPEQLRKLVWATADYWLMNDFLVTFQEVEELRTIFKRACQQFQGHNSKKYSSFSAYIEKYILNFAIKSQFNQNILSLICQVIDQYLESQPKIQRTIRQWISFSLPTITDKLIWLPKMLMKIGYRPENILHVQLEQLEAIFNKKVQLWKQILYGIKFLNCYILVDGYVQKEIPQFRKTIQNQLNFLQIEDNIEEKIQIGLKKMLDMLNKKSL